MEQYDVVPDAWRHLVFEVALFILIVGVFIAVGYAVFESVQRDLDLSIKTGGPLYEDCSFYYIQEVYVEGTEEISRLRLDEFYRNHPDCAVYNVTELDPLFRN